MAEYCEFMEAPCFLKRLADFLNFPVCLSFALTASNYVPGKGLATFLHFCKSGLKTKKPPLFSMNQGLKRRTARSILLLPKNSLLKGRRALMFTDTVLDNLHSIILFQNTESVSQYNERIQFILLQERHHIREPFHDDLGQLYRFHFHKNHPFLSRFFKP